MSTYCNSILGIQGATRIRSVRATLLGGDRCLASSIDLSFILQNVVYRVKLSTASPVRGHHFKTFIYPTVVGSASLLILRAMSVTLSSTDFLVSYLSRILSNYNLVKLGASLLSP